MILQPPSLRPPGGASRKPHGARRCTLGLRTSLLGLVALCVVPSLAAQGNPLGSLFSKSSQAAANPAPPAAAPAASAEAPTPTAIPLPEVATRAEELMRLLRDTRRPVTDARPAGCRKGHAGRTRRNLATQAERKLRRYWLDRPAGWSCASRRHTGTCFPPKAPPLGGSCWSGPNLAGGGATTAGPATAMEFDA